MLTVQIGKTFDDPKELQKTISWLEDSFSCKPSEPCNILSPVLILGYNANIINCNYVYISDWHRFYFYKDPQILTGGRMSLQLSIDPLYTWASTILNSEGIIIRATLPAPTLIPDGQYPLITSQRVIQNAVFSNPNGYFLNAANSSFILTTLSGDWTPPE